MLLQTLLSMALPMLLSYFPMWIILGLGLLFSLQRRERFPNSYKQLALAFGILLAVSMLRFTSFLGLQYLILEQKMMAATFGMVSTAFNCVGLVFDSMAWSLLFYGFFFAPRDEPPAASG
jgi:hypothetical protein